MPTVNDYIKELEQQRDKLATILVEKGIEASTEEKYNSLVAKVEKINGGEIVKESPSNFGKAALVGNALPVIFGIATKIE